MNTYMNPYIAGNPIDQDHLLFGRQDVLLRILQDLANPLVKQILLFGQRRVGKTSILLHLHRSLSTENYLPVYFDLNDYTDKPLGETLYELARCIYRNEKFSIELERENFDDSGRYFGEMLLPELIRNISGRRIVFLLDEFEAVDVIGESNLPQNVAGVSFIPFLRYLLEQESLITFLIAFGRHPDDLRESTLGVLKYSQSYKIGVLDENSARAIVLQAEENGTLHFNDQSISRLLDFSGRHPYMTQLLCKCIWDNAYLENTERQQYMIDVDKIDLAVPLALERGNSAFLWIWNGLTRPEKIYISAFAEAAKDTTDLTEEQVVQLLAEHASRLRHREIERAPIDLLERQILIRGQNKKYHFSVELFRKWVQENKHLQEVKRELDLLKPIAEKYYQHGLSFWNDNQLLEAAETFKKALVENNQHFQARLGLGEVLLELGDLDAALAETLVAYELDRKEARRTLIRLWYAKAHQCKKDGNLVGVIENCQSILNVSSNEQEAKELLAASQQELEYSQTLRSLRVETEKIASRHVPNLAKELSNAIVPTIISNILRPVLLDWRDGKITLLKDINDVMYLKIQQLINSEPMRKELLPLIFSCLQSMQFDINRLMKPIYERQKSKPFNILEIAFIEPDARADLNPDEISALVYGGEIGVSTLTAVGGFIGFFTGMLVSMLLAGIVITIAPLDWVVLPIIIGISYSVVQGIAKGQDISSNWATNLLLKKNIPKKVRQLSISESRIGKLLTDSENKIRDELEKNLSNGLIKEFVEKLDLAIARYLAVQGSGEKP